MTDAYRFCPECGFVGRTTYDVCEINGAGAPMIEVDQYVAEALIEAYNASYADDGTRLRIGSLAFGKNERGRWFVRRYRNGTEWCTGYGSNIVGAWRRAFGA